MPHALIVDDEPEMVGWMSQVVQAEGYTVATAEDMTKREVLVVPGPGNSIFSPLPAGFDFDSGEGFVDAAAAVSATPNP